MIQLLIKNHLQSSVFVSAFYRTALGVVRLNHGQGKRIKRKEVRAKPAKHDKGSERGLFQRVGQPFNISFEQNSSEIDEQSEF